MQAKKGQWVNWEGPEEKKKIKWSIEASRIRFMIGATYNVLPSPQNLHQWFGGDET